MSESLTRKQNTKESSTRKPFKTRLYASFFIWLIIVFLVASFGFIINSKTERRNELLGAQLPTTGLTLTVGKITKISYNNHPRRGTFVIPSVEFEQDGKIYQTTTARSYAMREFPYVDGQSVEVVFVASEPGKAWLKWEYDDLMTEYNSFFVRAYDAVGPIYNYLAAAIMFLTALFFTVNLFVPLFGFIKR
jgi:hypothetical protein